MRVLVLAAGLALGGCTIPENISTPALTYDNRPTVHFAYCISAGCINQLAIKFSEAEWAEIGAIFAGTRDAPDERHRIELAMSRFEQLAAPKGGTQNDKGGWDMGGPEIGQLDCFAEAANTQTALSMMAKSGFLKFHTPLTGQPTLRGVPYGTLGLIHASATIQENADGHLWVVDTWYMPSGGPSFVVDRGEWRAGWHPPDGAKS